MLRWPILFLAVPLLNAQTLTVKQEKVYNRQAWVLANGIIRVALLAGGGHIAQVQLLTGDARKDVNPMRVPHYPTIDPDAYQPSRDDAIYGDNPHRWLSAGYMGHLLCFPFYGPPSSEFEIKAKLGNHGEAPIVRWKELSRDFSQKAITFRYGADLPNTQYRVERVVTLPAGARYFRVEEFVENLTSFDRPYQWMQHATFGPPFIEPGKTVLDASVTRGHLANQEFRWPGNRRVMAAEAHTGSYAALLMDSSREQQFFTMFHPDYRVLIGYVFPTSTNPWLADWQENQRNTTPPWNGKVTARGMEFGNSPYAEGLRKAIDRGSLFGAPAYSWIGAHERRKTEFTVFLAEIPAGYSGTKDVKIEARGPRLIPQ